MRTIITASIALLALALTLANPAFCTDLVGTVADGEGQAVQGAQVVAHSSDGSVTQTATTNANGQYQIGGLDPGQYFITLQASGIGSQAQTVASYLGNSGLTVNWSVQPGATPIAAAQPGIQLTSATSVNNAVAVVTTSSDPPPGCKGKIGPPCGPKSKKRRDD
jgi:hypothetical protein